MPTDIGRCLLRSSGARWDRELALAVEIQQCPLRSGALEEARRRGGEEKRREEKRGEERRGEGAESYVKI